MYKDEKQKPCKTYQVKDKIEFKIVHNMKAHNMK